MKHKNNNKNIVIIMLAILLLVLAVGYAAFSDILTISGTANAKGTFDLEFQNVEVVKNVGADIDKTTATISEDKNTLTVNVVDLSYPGSGVEFSVDIVNVGTIPAEVKAVTPINITGSDKIKVTGLDVIKADHPKIEVGDKCNIHFTVEWTADAGEILENESSISFGLQVEYVQSTGEAFEGNTSHIDTDKNGNIINSNILTGEELIFKITSNDYGKNINYQVTIKDNILDNWKILYNDKSNIYIILDGYLPSELVPSDTGLRTIGKYNVYSIIDREDFFISVTTNEYWKDFAKGKRGAIAIGTPSVEMILLSYNEKNNTNLNIDDETNGNKRNLGITDNLYVPYLGNRVDETRGFWLSTLSSSNSNGIWLVNERGEVYVSNNYTYQYFGIRPVVKLPSTVEGTVGETVEINY